MPMTDTQTSFTSSVKTGDRVSEVKDSVSEDLTIPFVFRGQGGEYFKIWIVNLFLSILTLGIYSAWAKVRNQQYFYGNTDLHGSTFEYTANPVAILKGRLIAGAFLVSYVLINQLQPAIGGPLFLVLLAVMPWILLRSLMFNARNTVYRNVRLRFNGSVKDAYIAFLLWPLAGALTLGILMPLAFFKQQCFLVNNHSYGMTPFEFDARAKDYYKIFGIMILVLFGGIIGGALVEALLPDSLSFLGFLIILATYLFLFIYFPVKVFNLRFNQSTLATHGFSANMQVWSYARLVVVNTLAIVITLGLFRPWAMVRTARYKANHLSLQARGELDAFVANEETQVNALGEEMGEMFDFDVGL